METATTEILGDEVEEDVQKVEPASEEPKAEEDKERSVSETPPKGKRKSNVEKVRCDKCLRDFNPAYLSRHICKPVRRANGGASEGDPVGEPVPPIPNRPIEREITAVVPEDPPERDVTAADVALFLRKQEDSRRAERMAQYSAAMIGA